MHDPGIQILVNQHMQVRLRRRGLGSLPGCFPKGTGGSDGGAGRTVAQGIGSL
jgi:hypothetical protein